MKIDQSHCNDCGKVLWSGRTICPECLQRQRDEQDERDQQDMEMRA